MTTFEQPGFCHACGRVDYFGWASIDGWDNFICISICFDLCIWECIFISLCRLKVSGLYATPCLYTYADIGNALDRLPQEPRLSAVAWVLSLNIRCPNRRLVVSYNNALSQHHNHGFHNSKPVSAQSYQLNQIPLHISV